MAMTGRCDAAGRTRVASGVAAQRFSANSKACGCQVRIPMGSMPCGPADM